MTTANLLLLDADILAVQSAAIHDPSKECNQFVPTDTLLQDACEHIENIIHNLMAYFVSDKVLLCWSLKADYGYFRHNIYANYKANRKNTPKLALRKPITEYLQAWWPGEWQAGYEADDIMGIQATIPDKPESIIVSSDKDMLTVPNATVCRDFRWPDGEHPRIVHTTTESAQCWHIQQTLMGDRIDNVPGIYGCGPKKASAIADEAMLLKDPWRHVEQAFIDAGRDKLTDTGRENPNYGIGSREFEIARKLTQILHHDLMENMNESP